MYEYDYKPFWEWLTSATDGPGLYIIGVGITIVALLVIGFLVSTVRSGPMQAGEHTYELMRSTFFDIFSVSARRIWAIMKLVMIDSWRKRVWVVLVIFGIVLVFAGRFLSQNSQNPGQLYINFLLGFLMRYLMLIVMLVLSVFSIPSDFKSKIVFTVMTKPVRAAEIILGRVLGFMAIGTILMLIMGGAGYLFLTRTLQHTHEISASVQDAMKDADQVDEFAQNTENTDGHFHRILNFNPKTDENWTEFEFGHRHRISKDSDGKYVLDEPEELLRSRVQRTGSLAIRNAQGKEEDPQKGGVSVGKEWNYRRFIEGNSQMAAIWTFDNMTKEQFPDGINFEYTLRVFRTEQGVITKPIKCSLYLRNPENGRTSRKYSFDVKDNIIDGKLIPTKLVYQRDDGSVSSDAVEIFDPSEGFVSPTKQMQIIVECDAARQYVGMARRDLYIRVDDVPFWRNLAKGVYSIWLQMLLVISCGVLFSTFVSSPVALLCTVGFLSLGMNTQMIEDMCVSVVEYSPEARKKPHHGGGPVELFYRMIFSKGVMTQLDDDFSTKAMRMIDLPVCYSLGAMNKIIPKFDHFDTLPFVTNGYNIDGDLLAQLTAKALFFSVTAFILSVALLRLREVAR